MKANSPLCFALAVTQVFIFATQSGAFAAVPPSASLTLARTNGSVTSLSISNAGDQVWIVQGSSNLTTWTELENVKVFNGSYRRNYTNGADGNYFFRTFYDAAHQTILSATTNALGLPATNFNYASPSLPATFSASPILAEDNMTLANTNSDAGATLGRVLFYDRRLSTNQSISCASCHQQAHGFSDPRQFSAGHDGSLGTRNSMGLSNARWYQRKKFFWDERAATLEEQTLLPIQNPIEMGMTLDALTNRLAAEPFYTNLFALAFGTPAVNTNRISRALAQFVRSIISTQSRYDLGVTNGFANFTAQENLGRQLFFGQSNAPAVTCSVCHTTDNFVQTTIIDNNGLEFPLVDKGIGGVSGVAAELGKFKVPSLRNIELTAPYMHDGRMTNLEQVVEFYNSGVVSNANLSLPLRGPGGAPVRLNLTADKKAALVAFLKTLTDTNLMTAAKLSDPFNYGD